LAVFPRRRALRLRNFGGRTIHHAIRRIRVILAALTALAASAAHTAPDYQPRRSIKSKRS